MIQIVELPQPELLDFSQLQSSDQVKIVICDKIHKFTTDAEYSGTSIITQPIFGSEVYINNRKIYESTFGLPFIRFAQGSRPKITYHNQLRFTLNLCYPGLNVLGSIDDTSMKTILGPSTSSGSTVTVQFPKIINNQTLLWYHGRNLFTSSELISRGALGLVQIVDKNTEWLNNTFEYKNNQIILQLLDVRLATNGTQTCTPNGSCFTVVNGVSSISWDSPNFIDLLEHVTDTNLIKIDILNASQNNHIYRLGFCDRDAKIKSFHIVQTDGGLMDPLEVTVASISTGERIGVIINLDRFTSRRAYLFLYDYDLNESSNSNLTSPDHVHENLGDSSYIKSFLRITQESAERELSLHEILGKIRDTISKGSPRYYYNLPDFSIKAPIRNIYLCSGDDTNNITEQINGSTRLLVDLWNSEELDLNVAIEQYLMKPNNYRPDMLPSSKFRICKTNDQFSNITMISNDTLKVQIFTHEPPYGDFTPSPVFTFTVIFPATPLNQYLNIQEWVDLVNQTLEGIDVSLPDIETKGDVLIQCDWSFFPYPVNFIAQKTKYVKSAIIKTTNNYKYWIRLLGRWPLLQFFGKPIINDDLDSDPIFKISPMSTNSKVRLAPNKNFSVYEKCDDVETFGIFDSELRKNFPFYATASRDVQLPINCTRKCAELIIPPHDSYIGIYDGYFNDNINSFSVKANSTENWIYTNTDSMDSHSLHIHSTSGFTNPICSKNMYRIGPQESVSFHLCWPLPSDNLCTSIRSFETILDCPQYNSIKYFVESQVKITEPEHTLVAGKIKNCSCDN